MYRTGQNSFPIGRRRSSFGGPFISTSLRPLLFVVFAASLFATLRCGAEGGSRVVRSYDGNFVVEAPNTTIAASAAMLAELARKAVFDLLAHKREWSKAASIRLRSRKKKTPDGEMPLWTISVVRGEFESVRDDVYPSKKNDIMVLQVVALCLEDVAGAVPREKKTSPAAALPLWLSCGVAENLSRENAARLRQFAADTVRKGKFLPIEQLLTIKNLPFGETERELFFKESGSVVDFLLGRQDGRSKLRRAITGFRVEGDFGASLLFAFAGDFGALPELQEKWKKFAVERHERTIGVDRMTLSETKQALDGVLTVNIPVIDRDTLEESVITTDLRGLFLHRHKGAGQRIASEKASEVFQLSLRARPEYAPILQEYLQALSAIAKNDRKVFKRHFALAERLRKKLENSPYFEGEEAENGDTPNE